MSKIKTMEFIKKHDLLLIFSLVFLLEIIIGLIFVHRYGTTIFDIDAISYLYNSRNVIDKGEYSGLSVLVGTWLPLFQMILVPFTAIEKLYTTGLAGTIVNALMTAGAAVFLYRIAGGKGNRLAILAPVIFLSNIYVLIFGIIPMSEQTAIFLITAASYYFKNYLDTGELKEFINCSFVLILGSFTRYELWVVALYVVSVFLIREIKNRNLHRIGYAHLPLLGIAAWIFVNYLIHKDAFWFNKNPLGVAGVDSIFTLYPELYYFKDSVFLTLSHAFIQMNLTFGILLYAAIISAIIIALTKSKNLIFLLMFFIPAAVNVILMFRGQSMGWQRYFYTSVPGIVLLNLALLENIVWVSGLLRRRNKINIKSYNYNLGPAVLFFIIIIGVSVAGPELSSGQMNGHNSASLSTVDNRPWIFQGLDITNKRVAFSIESDKGVYNTDLKFDLLNILPAKDFKDIKYAIGSEKILMAYPDTSGYHPNLFSVSQGVSPSQIIDDFNYMDYEEIMMEPWKYVKFVLVPVSSPSAVAVNKWYNGTFYLYNYDYNQTWRSEFLNHYELVLDSPYYRLYELGKEVK